MGKFVRVIFISYSSENAKLADSVFQELEANCYPCFRAGEDVAAGEDWHAEIWDSLHRCHAFLGLVTADFIFSAFCQQELGAALALEKPGLLVFDGEASLRGFAARYQAVKTPKLLAALEELPQFRQLRVESWIAATRNAATFAMANHAYSRFIKDWPSMTEHEKLRWLLAAKSNSQVRGEDVHVGPFYRATIRELEPLLTFEWLFANDQEGILHNIELNPVGLKTKR